MTRGLYCLASFLLTVWGVFYSNTATAQFTYSGIRLSYHNVKFDKAVDFEGTRINDLVLNLDVVHRPLRNLGVGISARLPIIHGFKYHYANDSYQNKIVGGGMFNESKVDFAGGELEYNIKNTFSITLLGRLYFDTEYNYFLDVRYTFENYDEMFSYYRDNNSLPNENILHEESVTSKGIGFSLGYQPMIDDHLYFGYMLTVDFMSYDQRSFEYGIDTYSGGQDMNISSKIEGNQTAYEFSVCFGYKF